MSEPGRGLSPAEFEALVREGVRAALATRESAASVFGVPPEALTQHHEGIVRAVLRAVLPLVTTPAREQS